VSSTHTHKQPASAEIVVSLAFYVCLWRCPKILFLISSSYARIRINTMLCKSQKERSDMISSSWTSGCVKLANLHSLTKQKHAHDANVPSILYCPSSIPGYQDTRPTISSYKPTVTKLEGVSTLWYIITAHLLYNTRTQKRYTAIVYLVSWFGTVFPWLKNRDPHGEYTDVWPSIQTLRRCYSINIVYSVLKD